MPNYEIMFIVSPNATEEEVDKIDSQIEGVVTASGAKAPKIEKLGKRRLAYPVKKFSEGSYVLFTLEAGGAVVREIERRLRVMDLVIKYLTVGLDDDARRMDKIQAHRKKRADHRSHRAHGEGGGSRRGPNPIEQMAEE